MKTATQVKTITVVCGNCSTQHKVFESARGKRGKCRTCGELILVPSLRRAPPKQLTAWDTICNGWHDVQVWAENYDAKASQEKWEARGRALRGAGYKCFKIYFQIFVVLPFCGALLFLSLAALKALVSQ